METEAVYRVQPPTNPYQYSRKNAPRRTSRNPAMPNQKQNYINPRFKMNSARTRNSVELSPVVKGAPISPGEALARYRHFLNEFEMKEITNFPEIYFVGKKGRKIIPDYEDENNYGYDNDSHNYNLVAGDHLAYRFEIVALFGAGAFGQVAKCYDHKTMQYVAIKVIVNTDQMHEQGRIEAQILARLNKNEVRNVVKANDFFIFRSHICITFEILSKNLYELIESGNYQPLPTKLVRLYAVQILTALEQSHKLGIVHCDLKPENVLLAKEHSTTVKLIDFGSSCFVDHQMYEYIQSRYYRAPEVMIGINYGPPMDMWSFGLIIAELLTGTPLFPGQNEEEELWMISQLIGLPPRNLVVIGKRRDEFFDKKCHLLTDQTAKEYIPNSMDLGQVLKTTDARLVDFILRCLTWDQRDRMTASEALQHPWIRALEAKEKQKSVSVLPDLK